MDSVRAYLSAEQLAALTPWSVGAIEKMVSRGVLRRGVHWFQPLGRRTRLVFKWTAIVALIEGGGAADPGGRRGELDVERATEELRGMLGAGEEQHVAASVAMEAAPPIPGDGPGRHRRQSATP